MTLVVLACFGVVSGCGGSDGNNGGMTPTTCVTFISADEPTTFTAVSGAAACSAIEVRILVNGAENVYGGGFELSFDPDVVRYNGLDESGSYLGSDGAALIALEPSIDEWPSLGTATISVTRSEVATGVDFATPQEFCSFSFVKVAETGSTGLSLSNVKLFDPDVVELINVTASGGTFTIQ